MVMSPLSSLYKMIVKVRHKIYLSNIKSSKKLNVPVIVVGNITAGGTGKTPFVDYTLKLMDSKGIKAGVISRGYGGNYSGVTKVDLSENSPALKFGDESTLLQMKHSNVPIYLSGNRYNAGTGLLSNNKDVQAIICDDGFQHFALKRDFNIVLIDCTESCTAYEMLPKGRLREPLQGLERADFIVFTKSNWASAEQLEMSKKLVSEYFGLSEQNYAIAEYKSGFPKLEKTNVLLVSSIAKPLMFYKNISETNNFKIKHHLEYKDHHCYTEKDVDNIVKELNYNKCDWILTTEKDLVKLNQFDKIKSKIKTVSINVELVFGKESFERELFKVLN